MTKTINDLSNERQLVILCSRGVLREEHIQRIQEILYGKLDWKDILYQCITHRTLNLMYYHMKKLGLAKGMEEVLKVMKTQSAAYSVRNREYMAEAKKIWDKLYENGIKAAVLKGNYLAAAVYPSIETRTFNDLDLLIDLKDGDKIVEILEGMGYIQGQYHDETGEIIPSSRRQKMIHQMASHELQECLKKSESPFIPLFEVDLNFDVLWKGNCPYKINTGELLDRAVEVELSGSKTYMLDYEDFLVQLSCHLYKEAALLNWISDLRDLKLYKFADILMFIEKYREQIRWEKLLEFCSRTGCQKILYYAFHYVNLLYGQVIPEYVMSSLEPEDKSYLDEYGIENEEPRKWEFDFFTRLFDTDRVLEINAESMAKKNEFWDSKMQGNCCAASQNPSK